MLEKKFLEQAGVRDKHRKMVATGALNVYDQVVICDTTSAAITITLPNVSEAMGMLYSITLKTDGGNNVTIQDSDESYGWSDITLADALDRVLLFSDGLCWWTIGSVGL